MSTLVNGWAQVHCPKTAGTTVSAVLGRVGMQMRRVGDGHQAWHEISEADRSCRYLVGTVRDPWSWYQSWARHMLRAVNRPRRRRERHVKLPAEHVARQYVPSGDLTVESLIRGAVAPPEMANPIGLYDTAWATPYPHGAGLWTWAIAHYYGRDCSGLDVVISASRPLEGLGALLGMDIHEADHRRRNTGEGPAPALSDGVRALIAAADGPQADRLRLPESGHDWAIQWIGRRRELAA